MYAITSWSPLSCTTLILSPSGERTPSLAPPSCANNAVNLSHLPSSIKTPVLKDMLIWGSVTHQCSECMCECHIAEYKDYNTCVRTRERKEPADHLRDDISDLFHSSTEKGVSSEANIFSTFAQTHTLIHRCVCTDWAPVSESTWSVKDNPKGKQRANETLMSWSRISWSLLGCTSGWLSNL